MKLELNIATIIGDVFFIPQCLSVSLSLCLSDVDVCVYVCVSLYICVWVALCVSLLANLLIFCLFTYVCILSV
jgi:hypothetical protein